MIDNENNGTERFYRGRAAIVTTASLVLGAAIVLAAALPLHAGRDGSQEPAWRPVWSDEFDTPGLPDPAKWSYDVGGHGWGNRELQFYTEGRRENARVEDGRLIIEARREDWEGRPYTSARLNSKASWTYGRIDVRAKLPRGRGTWPAIWMLPVRGEYGKGGWPDNGEVDIMEHVGFDPGVVHGTIHSRAYNHVDRTQRGKSFRNLLNVAVGGNWGGQKGVDDSIWPQRFEIDYVRVSQANA